MPLPGSPGRQLAGDTAGSRRHDQRALHAGPVLHRNVGPVRPWRAGPDGDDGEGPSARSEDPAGDLEGYEPGPGDHRQGQPLISIRRA